MTSILSLFRRRPQPQPSVKQAWLESYWQGKPDRTNERTAAMRAKWRAGRVATINEYGGEEYRVTAETQYGNVYVCSAASYDLALRIEREHNWRVATEGVSTPRVTWLYRN